MGIRTGEKTNLLIKGDKEKTELITKMHEISNIISEIISLFKHAREQEDKALFNLTKEVRTNLYIYYEEVTKDVPQHYPDNPKDKAYELAQMFTKLYGTQKYYETYLARVRMVADFFGQHFTEKPPESLQEFKQSES